MANSRTGIISTGTERYTELSVDTDPGSGGYGCTAVSIQKTLNAEAKSLTAYIKTIGTSGELTLQWSMDNITFYAYEDSPYTTAPQRLKIADDSTGIYWRWAVLNGKQGTVTANVAGISW